MKNVLITGAGGFIGRYTVSELSKKFHIFPFDRKTLNITKPEDFNKIPKGIDAVVHPAGLLSIDAHKSMEYFKVNIGGTYNVCEFCRVNDIKNIIFIMTHSDVNRSDNVLISENTPRKYGGTAVPYIISKIAALELIQNYGKEYGIRDVAFRLPGVRGYGSRDSFYNCVFHQFIQKAIRGEPIEIWGEHKTVRDFVYIKDVTRAIESALGNDNAHGLYNIAIGKGHTIEDEANAIIDVFSPDGKKSRIVYRPDIPEVRTRSYIFDITKAEKDFGFKPKYSYRDGLVDMKKIMDREKVI